MKILLDPQIFDMQTYGGISRYYTEIFSRLKKNKELSIKLPIDTSNNVYIINSGLLKEKELAAYFIKILNALRISTRSLNRKLVKKKIRKAFTEKYDLVIPTYYDPYFLEVLDGTPFVLTVYDMVHELMPQYFTDDPWNVTENKKRLLEKATKIIAVSKNTKKDIIKVYPHIDQSKIEVIYHGNSIEVNENINVDLPKNYILFVGSRGLYKNFYFLVESIRDLLIRDKTLKLICAGGGEFKDEEMEFLKRAGIHEQVEQKYFDEGQLGLFYKNARCFVFPSLYEGFGIPVLESMSCGCPIVLSNRSSFPEVAGEAGIYFDVSSKEDLMNKIELVLNDEKLKNEYILKGIEQAKKFNWEIAASQCLELYKRAINEAYRVQSKI
ncbi:glycosyltransferase family 1 protein [Flavobacterium cheongpyeongense]|uniref:Glycosyltransferase family 1 protein n=1 Tax=Flavobacterium cheongpyeongense TaxID=2212651 RepID=A0A2V4BPC5_9FLAO|nr:glycosyltransferase family 1 protein [Flavobacterium cheongpyeongense]